MRNMLTWLPTVITALGGLLTVVGGLWLGIRQINSSADSDARNTQILDAAQDAAARAGNADYQRQLAELRSQLLNAERRGDKNTVDDIIGQLPALTKQFDKLNEENAQTVASMATDFELCWKPTISFTLAEFDRYLAQLKSRQIEVSDEQRNDAFPLTLRNQQSNYLIRAFRIKQAVLQIGFDPASLNPIGMSAARITFAVFNHGNADFQAELRMDFNESTLAGKRTSKPRNGIPPIALTDDIKAILGKAIERTLVIASSKTQ